MKKKEIYKNYRSAIERRRPDSALSWESFRKYIASPDVVYYSHEGSFLFGKKCDGIFFPSHFAPKGSKSAVELLTRLRSKAVCFAVTDDLSSMLQRLGYKRLPLRVSCSFRDTEVKKVILVSSMRIALKVTILIVKERFDQSAVKRSISKIRKLVNRISYDIRFTMKNRSPVIDEDSIYEDNEA